MNSSSRLDKYVGKKYGRLTVLKAFYKEVSSQSRLFFLCKCNCGTEVEVDAYSVKSGNTVSCGCFRTKRDRMQDTINSKTKPNEYSSWSSMRDRCLNPKSKNFPFYGGVGITICPEWMNSFETFYLDMGKKPTVFHQIDRIDNNEGYAPWNCRWATPKEQANNRKNTVRIAWAGEVLTLGEWSEKLGINRNTLSTRYYEGRALEEVFNTDPKRKSPRKYDSVMMTFLGKTQSVVEWSDELGISTYLIMKRKDAGWTDEEALGKDLRSRDVSGGIKYKLITYEGETHTLGEWAEKLGKNYDTLKNRFISGMPISAVLSEETFSPGRNSLRGDKYKDLIGKRFGKLVIDDIIRKESKSNPSRKYVYAVCSCDCGNIGKEIILSNLIGNKQNSCGDCAKLAHARELKAIAKKNKEEAYKISRKLKNIVGSRFHNLVVTGWFREKSDSGSMIYRLNCKCDCGNDHVVSLSNWGKVKSCGCLKSELIKESKLKSNNDVGRGDKTRKIEKIFDSLPMADSDLVGKKINRLEILEVRRHEKKYYAKCLCDCGNIVIKGAWCVTSGHTQSCGCARSEGRQAKPRDESKSKICKVGDTIGDYLVTSIYRQGGNLYAQCLDEENGIKDFRLSYLKTLKENL